MIRHNKIVSSSIELELNMYIRICNYRIDNNRDDLMGDVFGIAGAELLYSLSLLNQDKTRIIYEYIKGL